MVLFPLLQNYDESLTVGVILKNKQNLKQNIAHME